MRIPARGLMITGTDTGVGKTYVGAIIVRSLRAQGYRVGVYKPVASGCVLKDGSLGFSDAAELWQAAGRPKTLEAVCPQAFLAPLAPHLAAAAEGKSIDRRLLRTGLSHWFPDFDWMIVEGAGGLLSPISDEDYVADLAAEFNYPLVIVAPNRLGVINAVMQTVTVARLHNLRIAGVVLNQLESDETDPSQNLNQAELQRCLTQWPNVFTPKIQTQSNPIRMKGPTGKNPKPIEPAIPVAALEFQSTALTFDPVEWHTICSAQSGFSDKPK